MDERLDHLSQIDVGSDGDSSCTRMGVGALEGRDEWGSLDQSTRDSILRMSSEAIGMPCVA